ncbi:GSCOCG00008000001-RA-CDS, partial [Cotesia congregata]
VQYRNEKKTHLKSKKIFFFSPTNYRLCSILSCKFSLNFFMLLQDKCDFVEIYLLHWSLCRNSHGILSFYLLCSRVKLKISIGSKVYIYTHM